MTHNVSIEKNKSEKVNLSVQLNENFLSKTFIWNASGMFMNGIEVKNVIDFSQLGALVIKGITLHPRKLNKDNRFIEIKENYSFLNAVGVENFGIDFFIEKILPELSTYNIPIIPNLVAESEMDFLKLIDKLNQQNTVAALELNLSCPNINSKLPIAYDLKALELLVKNLKKESKHLLIAKIPPSIENIQNMGIVLENSGIDAISLINSIPAMHVNIDTRRSSLWRNFGGLTGPAIHPIALKMIHDIHKVVKIPIIGIGGIHNVDTAIASILAGAKIIQIGTSFALNPQIHLIIIEEISHYCLKHGISNINDLVGQLECL